MIGRRYGYVQAQKDCVAAVNSLEAKVRSIDHYGNMEISTETVAYALNQIKEQALLIVSRISELEQSLQGEIERKREA